jgi:bacterioferritin-associated ferredoxin
MTSNAPPYQWSKNFFFPPPKSITLCYVQTVAKCWRCRQFPATLCHLKYVCVCVCVTEREIFDFDIDMSYTRVLHPKVLHQRTASQDCALCKSQMTSHVLRHTAAAMRAHNVLQGTVEQLRWTVAAFLAYVLRCCT